MLGPKAQFERTDDESDTEDDRTKKPHQRSR